MEDISENLNTAEQERTLEEEEGERLFHDLELRYISLRNEHESVCQERNSLMAKNTALEKTLVELRGSAENNSGDVSRHSVELRQRDSKIRELEQSTEKLGDQYARKCEESERLRDDVKMQADQLVSFQSRLKELQTALSEAESKLLPAQYALSKLEREQEGLKGHVAWLEDEVNAKTAQLFDLRRDMTQKNDDLSSQLLQVTSDSNTRSEQVTRLTDELALREERMHELARQVRNLETEESSQRENFLAEVDASKRMADLYKRHLEEATDRVSELEEEVSMWEGRIAQQQQQFQANLAIQADRAKNVLEQSEEASKHRIVQLEEELAEAKRSEVMVQQQIQSSPSSAPQLLLDSSANLLLSDSSNASTGLSAVDMLDKVVQAEKTAAEEARKRKECELYLEKILKDIEGKAPLIASQRRDYKRILESHTQLSQKVDELVNQCSEQKSKLSEAEKSRKLAVLESTALENQNMDMARQLQHLLRKSMGLGSAPTQDSPQTDSEAGGVISDYLVTFDSIEELQVRNMQLLKVVRKLSGEQEEALYGKKEASSNVVVPEENVSGRGGFVSADAFADMENALKSAVAELSGMRDSRHRMEEMMSSLAHQRDIYRAMLEEVDASAAAKVSGFQNSVTASPFGSPTSLRQQVVVSDNSSMGNRSGTSPEKLICHGEFDAIRSDLLQSQETVRSLQDRNSRLEEAEAALSEAADRNREELASLRSQLGVAKSETRFQEHRVATLERALKSSQSNEESLSKRRIEAESLLMVQQKEARQQQDVLLQQRESLRLAEEKIRRAEIAAEVGGAAEVRLQAQITDLRGELKRQSALAESMGRIESSLAKRMQEERESLEREVLSLTGIVENCRKEFNEAEVLHEQKLQTMEEELRLSRTEKERRTEEATALREDLIRQQGVCVTAQERSAVLERQLTIAQDRLSAMHGASTSDSLLSAEMEQQSEELERACREIEDLKSKLESSETHMAQFRTISNSTETMLRELQMRSAESKHSLEEDLGSTQKELEGVRKELCERKDQLKESLKESENLRDNMQKSIKKLEDELGLALKEKAEAEEKFSQAQLQVETLKADTLLYEETAKESTSNYERELALHARAAANLREVEKKLRVCEGDLLRAHEKTAELSGQCLECEARLQEQESASTKRLTAMREDIAAQKHTNDLLHNQVQSMSVQLSRLTSQTSKKIALLEMAESEGANESVSDDIAEDETSDLRKSSFELREVIRCMKREKDMTEARLSLSETEKHRYSAQLSSVQKALDETRAELQRELDAKSNPTRSEEDFARILVTVNGRSE